MDGSDVQLITSGLRGPRGIELHNNDIYFTESIGNLYKQSKSPGSSKSLIHSNASHMFDVKVYQKYTREGNVKCRDGQSSESGYYPGCAYNWTLVAIGSALGVVAAILLVIGLIYFKNKNSKEQIFVKFDNEKDTTSRDHEIT